MDQILTPALAAIFATLLMAAVVFGKDFLTNRSLKTTQESLKITLENIDLNANIAARKAELVAQELAASQQAQRNQAESLAAQALILGQVAHDTAEAKVIQAATGAKVDGQMTELHRKIAELSNALVAEKQAGVTEKDKAATLAVQTEKDRGESAAKLAAAQRAPATPRLPEQGESAPDSGMQVNVPAVTLPVEKAPDRPLIVTS